jgi:hypothetical protein
MLTQAFKNETSQKVIFGFVYTGVHLKMFVWFVNFVSINGIEVLHDVFILINIIFVDMKKDIKTVILLMLIWTITKLTSV